MQVGHAARLPIAACLAAFAALAGLAALFAACDPQADAGYLGEPLLTLHGQVQSTSDLPPLEAAMLWQRGAPPSTDDQELATRAPVESNFPANFTLHLYQPPPSTTRRTLATGEVEYARANAAAVPYGIAATAVGGALPACASCGFGIDPDHWVIHLSANVPAGSLTEWWLGAALPAGFHLLRFTALDPRCLTGALLDACTADLVGRGVRDGGSAEPGTARWFCTQPYRLAPAPPGELLLLKLGPPGAGAGGACP